MRFYVKGVSKFQDIFIEIRQKFVYKTYILHTFFILIKLMPGISKIKKS